jgi:hypothetical protein
VRLRTAVPILLLTGCTPDPAVVEVSALEPATANAQYFHGNCFAGFSVGVNLLVQETRGVEVAISSFDYRIVDRGTGLVLLDESLDPRTLEDRYGGSASVIRAGGSQTYPLSAISSDRPVGPLAVTGEIRGLDANDQEVTAAFDLSARLEVNDPGPPSDGACTPP